MKRHTIAKNSRVLLVVACAGLLAAGAAHALTNGVSSEVEFSIPRSQIRPFVKQITIRSQGRIVLDVIAAPRDVELNLLLRRTDGTVASRISGTGGNLSISYFATEREVKESLAAKNPAWSVEISKPPGSQAVSGRLKAAHPGP